MVDKRNRLGQVHKSGDGGEHQGVTDENTHHSIPSSWTFSGQNMLQNSGQVLTVGKVRMNGYVKSNVQELLALCKSWTQRTLKATSSFLMVFALGTVAASPCS